VCSNGPNKMYLNEGNLKFRDITESAGLVSDTGFETAVTAVDINNDGLLDFYVCRAGVERNEARRTDSMSTTGISRLRSGRPNSAWMT
jgi:enediyne biosynthesis protein E4